MPELDKSNDSFMYHYSIEGIDAKQLHYVKVAEPSYLGGKKIALMTEKRYLHNLFLNK